MFNKILVVCVGNICRSPTGERLLQQKLPNKIVSSAGIGTERSGLTNKPADKTAQLIAEQHGVSLEAHQAQQLTNSLCRQYDLILVMEKGHLDAVYDIAPEARGKTMLFGQWIEHKEIPDPFRKSQEEFEYVFDLIEKSANGWAKKLQ
ncbi:arsenate reductase/protein-tyrosine-phosphatase family protein [Vibrio casei]|uniref:arsenate reductase/protein-tyrosine-phosphatase family protein n=1 Tax=Vibrio casei TaxID=673372 RepID=UPI003F979642